MAVTPRPQPHIFSSSTSQALPDMLEVELMDTGRELQASILMENVPMEEGNNSNYNTASLSGNEIELSGAVHKDTVMCFEASTIVLGDANASGNISTGMDSRDLLSSPNGMIGVCANASKKNFFSNIIPKPPISEPVEGLRVGAGNIWNHPKVVPMPAQGNLESLLVDGKSIQLDEETLNSNIKKFDMALVGRLFGKKIPFHYLNSELSRRWNMYGQIRLMSITADCFVCFFNNTEARNAVLMRGPWVIAGQVLGLDVWTPSFSPSSLDGFTTPVWVRLPRLPLYCWDVTNIARITTFLGEPMWVDAITERMERVAFARACVKINLEKPLQPGVWVRSSRGLFFQPVEYEGLSLFCFNCGYVGHKATACNNSGKATSSDLVIPQSQHLRVNAVATGNGSTADEVPFESSNSGSITSSGVINDQHGLGPWMLVAGRKRSAKNNKVAVVARQGQHKNKEKVASIRWADKVNPSPSQAHGEYTEAGMAKLSMSEPGGTHSVASKPVFGLNGVTDTSLGDGRYAQSTSQHALPPSSMSSHGLAPSPHSSLKACGELLEANKVIPGLSEAGVIHGGQPQQVVGFIGIKDSSHCDGRNAQNLSHQVLSKSSQPSSVVIAPHYSLIEPHSSFKACGELLEANKVIPGLSEAGVIHGGQPQQVVGLIGIKDSSHLDGRNAQSLYHQVLSTLSSQPSNDAVAPLCSLLELSHPPSLQVSGDHCQMSELTYCDEPWQVIGSHGNDRHAQSTPPCESYLEVAPHVVNRRKSVDVDSFDWDFTPVADKKPKLKKKKKKKSSSQASHMVTRSQVAPLVISSPPLP